MILKHGGGSRAPPMTSGSFQNTTDTGDGRSHLYPRHSAAPAGRGRGSQLGLRPGSSGYGQVMKRLSSSGYDYGQAPHSLTTFFIYTRICNSVGLCGIREITRITESTLSTVSDTWRQSVKRTRLYQLLALFEASPRSCLVSGTPQGSIVSRPQTLSLEKAAVPPHRGRGTSTWPPEPRCPD